MIPSLKGQGRPLITFRILPYRRCPQGMLRSSGGLTSALYFEAFYKAAGIPEEVMPLIIMKPLSGSALMGSQTYWRRLRQALQEYGI